MNPPGKTTLPRMQKTAFEEQERIEISEGGRVREGLLPAPRPELVAKRDDFAGLVRLIDIICSDQVLLERLQERMAARQAAARAPAAAAGVDPSADIAIDAEPEPS
jgi:hypothetical protein